MGNTLCTHDKQPESQLEQPYQQEEEPPNIISDSKI